MVLSHIMREEGAALDHRRRVIRTIDDAEELHTKILDGAARTVTWIRNFDADADPMDLLRKIRFEMVGHDPLTGEALNMVEQLNQTFTILASLRAVERLFELHPEANGFRLALGTCSGRDIESVKPNLVAAEVFSATHPNSNNKLRKEIARLEADQSLHRYVFFSCPKWASGRHERLEIPGSGVQVYATDP